MPGGVMVAQAALNGLVHVRIVAGQLEFNMSFDKNYPNRKDQRKPYYRSKAFDRTCRNHGSCTWCAKGRQHKHKKGPKLDDWDNSGR